MTRQYVDVEIRESVSALLEGLGYSPSEIDPKLIGQLEEKTAEIRELLQRVLGTGSREIEGLHVTYFVSRAKEN